MQRAHYTVSSRTIDEAHRPRIVRRPPVALAARALPEPGTRRRRHHRPRLGLVLGAALAGWATILPVSTPHWPQLIASSAAPQSSGGAPPADSVVVPVPMAASAAAPDPDPGVAATAGGSSSSRTLGAPVAITAAAETPASGTSPSSAAGFEAVTAPPKPLLDEPERPRAEAPARSQRNPSSAVTRAAPRVSPRHHEIVVQLSSYGDQARARQAAEKLHRSLQKMLRGSPIRTEEARVHGKPVWRVVAGPVPDREHGKKLCDALRHAGQSCVIMAL